ncbi:DMT family transporter [Ornithinimicrobium sp. INDO-MA30-4]|uniref:DMT family transporter n=1 Tax=Ornithinimicrobium sp. INDO-MA30-4 TaxID=2908651 RepID=UPI001F3BE4F7|nr:DMT family transporter [Ornithinimicrobium sp. INDO-MA30-4]UJH69775.1 DMT family transporter [Ornithinimicrobium sp. INDO-MA30-4]
MLFGLVPVVIYAAMTKAIKLRHVKHIHHFVVMSLLATAIYLYAFAAGTSLLESGIAGALSGAIPLFSFVAAVVFLKDESINPVRVFGVVLGFAGVVLVARPWDTSTSIDLVGVGYMMAGSLSVGVSFVYAKKFLVPLKIAPAALTTYQMALGLGFWLWSRAPRGWLRWGRIPVRCGR